MTSQFSERHREVLRAAMRLIAERGLSKSSLRALAKRVGMSQPSLYHYFDSKDQLVQQIIELRAETAISMVELPATMPDLAGFLRHVFGYMLRVYDDPDHPIFVRFMFAVTMEKSELGALLRSSFLEKGIELARPLLDHYVASGEVADGDVELMFRLAMNGLILHLIETRVLHTLKATPAEDARLADFIADVVYRGVLSRSRGECE